MIELHSLASSIGPGWKSENKEESLQLYKVTSYDLPSQDQPAMVSVCIVIYPDLSWKVIKNAHSYNIIIVNINNYKIVLILLIGVCSWPLSEQNKHSSPLHYS